MQLTPLRDYVWASMERSTAPRHAELWRDLLTRCPESRERPESPTSHTSPESTGAPVPSVSAVASLTAFAHWLDGDAVKARAALARVPAGTAHLMARLVDVALELGMDPRTWSLAPEDRDDLDAPHHDPSASPKSVGLGHAIDEPPKASPGRGNAGPPR
ncbi:DUF4192 family protein [Terrabacter sp. NPDC000476]|uniref:DUF4192 family protein n=1 Tax=Terrabacter sp. NPDC000476 TaxID=3154258 RepID=UPI00332238FA